MSKSIQPKIAERTDVELFSVPVSDAISAKRALQSALERIEKVRSEIIGSKADQLDHAQRDISVAITLLRDCNRNEQGFCRTSPPKVTMPPRENARTVTCPECGTPKETSAKTSVQCLACRHTWTLNVKNPRGPYLKSTIGDRK
jgi:hypothetical protein